jgi:hypothetical protein
MLAHFSGNTKPETECNVTQFVALFRVSLRSQLLAYFDVKAFGLLRSPRDKMDDALTYVSFTKIFPD